MFINFTNHNSKQWSDTQKAEAARYGDIFDFPFPNVPPNYSSDEVNSMADDYTAQIMNMYPDAVMCQGEFTLTFAVVTRLKANGVPTLVACTERKLSEVAENGATQKVVTVEFVQFREY